MMGYEKTVEEEIQAKGLLAPRVTPDMVEEQIVGSQVHVFPGTTVTVVLLKLRNGFSVVGESACASPENFNAEIGERIATENARQKIWPLLGYALKEKLIGVPPSIPTTPMPVGSNWAEGTSKDS
jgi:hypothetical protein